MLPIVHCVQEINTLVCDWLHCSTLQTCYK